MQIDRAMVTAADYHDALVVARRAKSAAVLLALVMLLTQLALFFTARYTDLVVPTSGPAVAAPTTAATLPAVLPSQRTSDLLHYTLGLTMFVGFAASVLLSVLLLLLVKIMLVGRAIGVGPVTSAFVWSLVLLLLLFPWQAFLGTSLEVRDFVVPGVLYTWDELVAGAKFADDFGNFNAAAATILKWSRFVVFPLVAVVLLLVIQVRSNRGLKLAVSEPRASEEIV
jgi:hypothetical protein